MAKNIILWHSLKIFLFYKLCKYPKLKSKFQTSLMLVYGAVAYKILSKIVDWILCKVFKLRTMSVFDEFFLADEKKSVASGFIRFEKFDFDYMSAHIKLNFAQQINGAKTRLV